MLFYFIFLSPYFKDVYRDSFHCPYLCVYISTEACFGSFVVDSGWVGWVVLLFEL